MMYEFTFTLGQKEEGKKEIKIQKVKGSNWSERASES